MTLAQLIVASVYGLDGPKLPCYPEIFVLCMVCHIQRRSCNEFVKKLLCFAHTV